MATIDELRQSRIDKLKKLNKLGIQAYPARSSKDLFNKEIVDNYDAYEGKKVTIAGRIMSWREHGKIAFGHIQDQSGRIQLFIQKDVLTSTNSSEQTIGFQDLDLLDIGDFIQATGTVQKTTRGEVSIVPQVIKLLTKSIRPLPDKWKGLKDKDQIFRRRYVDLVVNPEKKELFIRKSKFWEVNRAYMKEHGFMEVETPILEHVTGGADARPFRTHMNALNQNYYLRISTELYLKRLIGAGFEKIYTFGPNFRNEGISDEHLPEYYQIEWYWAYADYRDNMKYLVDMFRHIAKQVYNTTKFTRGKHTFDLNNEWKEIDYCEIIKKQFDIDIFKDNTDKMLSILQKQGIALEGALNRNRIIDNLWKIIRKTISGPAFLVNEPTFMSPLAKSKPDNPRITERFHIIIGGSELGNGYTELNDPFDQLERFKAQQEARDAGDEEAQMMDIDYVEMLEYGMPPTSGYAHSERLFWFLENASAREATFFPHMKHHVSENTKRIYGLEDKTVSVYDYRSRKIIAVINKELSIGKALNALGHMAFSAGYYSNTSWMGKKELIDASDFVHTGISKYPFNVLEASSDQIRSIIKQARDLGVSFTDYPQEMCDTSHDDKLVQVIQKKKEKDMVYQGVVLKGERKQIEELTHGLKLYSG